MTYTVIPAELVHAQYLATHLREQDKLELQASSGKDPVHILLESIAISDVAWVALYEGNPCAVWGVCKLDGNRGGAWLLGTEAMYVNKRETMRLSRRFVKEMHKRYDILCNFVDERNTVSCRWLDALGFNALFTTEYGVEKRPFIFYESNNNV